MMLPPASGRQRLVFVLEEEAFGFRVEVARVAVGNADGAEERGEFAVRM